MNTKRTEEINNTSTIFAPPRPHEDSRGMTKIGAKRDEYNATVEGRPTRFIKTNGEYRFNPKYLEWTIRADTWNTKEG